MKWIWHYSLNYSKIRDYKDLDSGFKEYCSQKLIIKISIMVVIEMCILMGKRYFQVPWNKILHYWVDRYESVLEERNS